MGPFEAGRWPHTSRITGSGRFADSAATVSGPLLREFGLIGSAHPRLVLDDRLSAEQIAPAFKAFGRVHIPGILEMGSANSLYTSLVQDTPWNRIFNRGEQVYTIKPHEWDELSADQRQTLLLELYAVAGAGFQFLYDSFNISEASGNKSRLRNILDEVLNFLNSKEFLDFIKKVTGDRRIETADAQATRYGAGHFLTAHSDDQDGSERLYAYVLNLTPEWRADWGGLLAFIDPDGHVAEAYTPKYNALNLFSVPQPHCVTAIAPYARAQRYSITGWLKGARGSKS